MIALPSVHAASDHRTLTLAELRELVDAATALGLPDDAIVRGAAIPFKLADLGNPIGSCITKLGFDRAENV